MPTSPLLKHSAVLSPKKAAKKTSEIDLSALRVRDPYIFSDANTHTYYLFYNSFHTYCLESKDLLHWDNCRVAFHNDGAFDQNWASEVHAYNGHYYLFSALRKDASDQRGCYREPLNKSSAADRQIFCPSRAVPKTGNTQSIPPLLEASAEPKSSAVGACGSNQSFLR